MTERDTDDRMIDTLFEAARADRERPGEDWLARVTGDALAEAAARPAPCLRPPGVLAQFSAILGGWRGLGGLAAAGIMGVAVGIAEPETVNGMLWTSQVFDAVLADDVFLADLLDEI